MPEDVERASTPMGGQFALGGGRVGATSHKPAPKGHVGAKPGAHGAGHGKHAGHHGPLGYDGKTGAGYGLKGGDARVRTLQQALNRFHLTDADGKPLVVDGKYGPRTTAAVKKAQQAIGMAATGKVTEDFIHRLAASGSLHDIKPPAKAAKKPAHRSATILDRAEMSGAAINDLPDSAFAHIEPGGTKDANGRTVPRSKRHFPVHDAAHVRNALARAPQSPFGDKAMPKIKAAAKKFGVEVTEDNTRSRLWAPTPTYDRTFRLTDIEISRSGGDGRTVEAYCAVFDTPAEIRDQHGHYMEQITRTAFNRQIGLGIDHVGVYYHHGMTIHGTPSDVYSVPIGKPLEIRPDGRGLRTATRYNDGPDADRILEAIRNDAIRGYSFRGPIYGSNPDRVPKRRAGSPLPVVTRTALGLTEYGPTPAPAYESAGILAIRSTTEFLENLADEDRELFKAELIRIMSPTTPPEDNPEDPEEVELEDDQEATIATSDESELGAEDQPAERSAGHSGRQLDIARARLKHLAELRVKGLINA